jgi:hypothetical protein
MTNEQSTLVDSDAANKAADADMAFQELGADVNASTRPECTQFVVRGHIDVERPLYPEDKHHDRPTRAAVTADLRVGSRRYGQQAEALVSVR